ncbi:MAG: FAD-dependent oxidoreductase [Clostridia bacterium]|nr:FAD-dependent oxidoreductase [Clostridia bacterium]
MNSIWKKTSSLPSFPSLDGDIDTDVLIIGGGICGVLCAYMLEQNNIDYVLLEGGSICQKTTANTTAKITSQHGLIYDKLISEFSSEFARGYYDANEDAISEFASMCQNIDCDFEFCDSYVFSLKDEEKISNEAAALEKLSIPFERFNSLDLPFKTYGAIKFENQAQFNPLKFISAISKDLNIYENSHVTEMKETTAITQNGRVNAKRVIVATHFPFINKHGFYFLKMYQHRSYAIALENAPNVNGMYVSNSDYGLSLRNYGDLLIMGGEGHRPGTKTNAWDGIEKIAKKCFPDSKVVAKWATQDCMTLDKVPYIGKYSSKTRNLFVATGFNKWGMSSSMVAAKLLCDIITGKENKYASIFSPSRRILRPQLAINTFEALKGWISFSKKRCPHLGCTLKWNKHEHTWDCPCHGSRFKENGTVLDGPANENKK